MGVTLDPNTVWTGLLGGAFLFTCLGFIFGSGIQKTQELYGRGFNALVKVPMFIRLVVFPYVASFFWGELSLVTSASNFATASAIAILFLGITLITFVSALIFTIWASWAIFLDNPRITQKRRESLLSGGQEVEGPPP
jgi:hypothetical protein